jgi:hypothetical protein
MNKNEFLEELEDLALQMVSCRIIYQSESGMMLASEDRIRRVFEWDGHWFIETGKGMVLRLERLVEVGERQNSDFGGDLA